MLKIRLARGGKKKKPFYRIVLTEHTKPVQSGYMTVLGWFDPMHRQSEMDIDAIKEWIGKGAQPSNRVAKLARKYSDDKFFDKYIVHTDRVRKPRNAQEEAPAEEAPAAPEATADDGGDAPTEEATETPAEETPAEPGQEAAPEAPAEEAAPVVEEVPAAEEAPAEEAPAASEEETPAE